MKKVTLILSVIAAAATLALLPGPARALNLGDNAEFPKASTFSTTETANPEADETGKTGEAGETDETEPPEIILPPLLISEVYLKSGQAFLELVATRDLTVAELAKYYVTATAGATSASFSSNLPLPVDADLRAGDFLLVTTLGSGVLTNPLDTRFLWLCNSATSVSKADCQNGKFIDLAAYPHSTDDRFSFSRQFDATDNLLLVKSWPTPAADNEFYVEPAAPPVDPAESFCEYLKLSELSLGEQWVELFNDSTQEIRSKNLADCYLTVQKGDTFDYDNLAKEYQISLDVVPEIAPFGYAVLEVATTDGLSLPKSKNRLIMLHDETLTHVDEFTYSTHAANTSWARFAADGWRLTYAPTKGESNIFQPYQICETGKHINEATGNCVKDVDPPADCADGQYRNPLTNRCKKIAAAADSLTDCADGYFRNPLTNRCKKIADDDELKPCADGWERNPETNRCRKKVSSDAAGFAVEPSGPTGGNLTALLTGAGVLAATAGIVLWQFRLEIARPIRRLWPKHATAKTETC